MNSASSGWAKITSALANPTRNSVPAATVVASRLERLRVGGRRGSIADVGDRLERDRRIRELERGFRSAGLPLLTEDYSATEDVFTRAIPLLAVVFVLEILGAINLDWPGGPERPRAARRRGPGPRRVRPAQRLARPAGSSRSRASSASPSSRRSSCSPWCCRSSSVGSSRARSSPGSATSLAARPGLARRRVRRLLDPAVDRRTLRPAARSVADPPGSRASAPAVLLAGHVLHQRVLAAVRRGERRHLLRRRRAVRAHHRDLPRSSGSREASGTSNAAAPWRFRSAGGSG